ncbi:methylenetetrahydrofolate--tRNA-(uracil-5-)-methyltransferase [Bacilli bacterium PM5-9]|nr:methylenetetrahydrofolate--tRNA-(uracil-5-)-methyltransferase [Bacilli bacterium PM5-9]
MEIVNIIGAGLAGCEATYQLAKRGIKVNLYEMRPKKYSPAHKTDYFGELVCSNSFRGNQLINAVGVLKEELLRLDSIVIKTAHEHSVPAGAALAVDRDGFAKSLTNKIKNLDNVTIINDEIDELLEGHTIVATGPLTSDKLSEAIKEFTNEESMYFYDAAAPIIEKDSINMDVAYYKSRYDKGEASYINCPMNQEQFEKWYEELINAKCTVIKEFEKEIFFEGCMPIEEIARRGPQTLTFGPLKPVGLGKDDERPYAVVQLRQDDAKATLYNIVGFQTHLTWPEQDRIIKMIPGLEQANIIRYGVMHRNTFINAPKVLLPTYQTQKRSDLFFAGQVSGVEGYVESIASGLNVGLNMARLIKNEELLVFPQETIIGSLAYYITNANGDNFQPMNANFGIVKDLGYRVKKKEKKEEYAKVALNSLDDFIKEHDVNDC